MKPWLALALLLAAPAGAQTMQMTPAEAQAVQAARAPAPKSGPPRPVLVEMFTSQSCSSCPPADALLQALAAGDKGILPLSLNVTYWNNTGWFDTDSMDETTTRQFWYAGLAGSQNVYTPEAVVDGTQQLIGSNRRKLVDAIAAARASPAGNVAISISGGAMLALEVPAGVGAGQIILFGYDSHHVTAVKSGETAGLSVSEVNVVRSLTSLGPWNGFDERFKLPHPAGQHVAVVLQAKDGSVLGLASL